MQLKKEVYLISSCKKSVQSSKWLLWNKDVKSKVAAKNWQKNHFFTAGLIIYAGLVLTHMWSILAVAFSMIDECG